MTVEFALILPAFLMLMVGVMEFGRLFFALGSLQYATSQAARCKAIGAAPCASSSLTASYAASKVTGVKVDPSVFTVNSSAGCGVLVSANFAYQATKPIPINTTLKAKACHPAPADAASAATPETAAAEAPPDFWMSLF